MNNKNENNFVACVVYRNVSYLRIYLKDKAITINTKSKTTKSRLNLLSRNHLLSKKQIQSTVITKKEFAKTYP